MSPKVAADSGEEWEETEEGSTHIEIPPEYRTLEVEQREFTVRDLWSRFLSGELILEPDFQRHYVWDPQRASRFVESILLGLPVPPIFLAENPNGTLDVIDGHQRLETLFRFMGPLLAGPSGEQWASVRARFPGSLALVGLEVLGELEGRDVRALGPGDRSRIWERALNVILVKKESHPDLKFVLFARLNQGAMALNPQELRNCLYRGPYNNLIARLAEDPSVLKLFGRRQPDKRMRDRERVLRFFALAHRREYYRPPFRSFLNHEMVANQYAPAEDLQRFHAEFQHALSWTSRVFAGVEFRLFRTGTSRDPKGFWDRRMDLVYDSEMVGFYQVRERLDELWARLNSENDERELFLVGLRRRLIDVMVEHAFLDTLREQTLHPHVIRRRMELWSDALHWAIDNWGSVVKDAEKAVKLQRRSTACVLCPQHLSSLDDAVVLQLSAGEGLAHRFCTSERAR